MGGMNCHIELDFEDGVRRLARVQSSNATSPPHELQDCIMQSEVATLTFLEKTKVPSPRVFDYALERVDNAIGVGYVLFEQMPGNALSWSTATPAQKRKVLSQIANYRVELRQYPFSSMGSLITPGSEHVGPFANESLTDCVDSTMNPIGLCTSLEEYHVASIKLIMHLILREDMYIQQAIEAYLINRFVLDIILLVSPECTDGKAQFYLTHGDAKGDQILVDEDYSITGIIDWEWAHITSAALAFKSPFGLMPARSFFDVSIDLGDDEADLAQS